MTVIKRDPSQPNKYGILYSDRNENARPNEIAPGLFDGTRSARYSLIKGQKGWRLSGRIGYVGGFISVTAVYDGQLPESFILSPYREPGGEVDLELNYCSLDIVAEGMLDHHFELMVRRTY